MLELARYSRVSYHAPLTFTFNCNCYMYTSTCENISILGHHVSLYFISPLQGSFYRHIPHFKSLQLWQVSSISLHHSSILLCCKIPITYSARTSHLFHIVIIKLKYQFHVLPVINDIDNNSYSELKTT